ncbi:MAG: hypothetical protein PVI20_04035 [Desulfobacteraceae bacterium]
MKIGMKQVSTEYEFCLVRLTALGGCYGRCRFGIIGAGSQAPYQQEWACPAAKREWMGMPYRSGGSRSLSP